MSSPPNFDELDLFVWEGKADILDRIARCMASFDVEVIRADGMPPPQQERGTALRPSVAIISVTVIDGGGLAHATELLQGMPVIWVAAASRDIAADRLARRDRPTRGAMKSVKSAISGVVAAAILIGAIARAARDLAGAGDPLGSIALTGGAPPNYGPLTDSSVAPAISRSSTTCS